MPQKTNLNISPYYDDFKKDNNFYRVLFNPGKPVQARELSTLQSILQDQIETFGSHMFKEGSMVIPGNISYDPEYFSIKLDSIHLGIAVSVYVENLKGKILTGQVSGIKVLVDDYSLPNEATGITDLTFFIKYLDSGNNNGVSFLQDGEDLLVDEGFVYGNTPINSGDSVATLIENDATYTGCSASIGNGVFFIRGHFVNVSADRIVLDPYTNNPSYRVGLFIQEELVNADADSSLNDNARGFSNFAAPGADRLKISTTLTKKGLTDFNDKNFVELIRLDDGELKKLQNSTQYSLIRDYFAKRTFEESGNYSLKNFKLEAFESLNDGISNEGIFTSDELTDQGATPSDDLLAVKVSPGKAYVRGYDIERPATTVLDLKKPRDKKTIENSSVPFRLGTLFQVNRAAGTPKIGLDDQSNRINLFDQRKGATNNATSGSGSLVGSARVYAFENHDRTGGAADIKFDLYLFDIQTFTTLTVNKALTSTELPDTGFVEGLSSGASGFSVSAGGNSATINLRDTSGTFIEGEEIKIDGVRRTIASVSEKSLRDVKSVYQDASTTSLATDFSADLVLKQSPIKELGPGDEVNVSGSNVLTCAGKTFGSLRVGDILIVNLTSNASPVFNRVSAISTDLKSVTLAAVQSVTNVCVGTLLQSNTPTGIHLGLPATQNLNTGLFAELQEKNVSDIDLTGSELTVKSQIAGKSTSSTGELTFNTSDLVGISSALFETFDNDRYSVHLSNGNIESISSDQFSLSNNASTVTITGLTPSQSNVSINVTVKKISISTKQKTFDRSQVIIVDKCVSGISTVNGLTQNSAFGLRVEDKVISLNTCDVVDVVGVYESLTNSQPVLDRLVFVSGLALNTSSILGEKIKGSKSSAVAQITARLSATTVEIAYLTPQNFLVGERVTFEESNIVTNLQGVTAGSYLNITSSYTLDKGQRASFYDYSRIVRKDGVRVPNRNLRIIVNRYIIPANDKGDVYTVGSYDEARFGKDIPILPGGIRATDTLDFRPRLADYTATNESPFAFESRNFETAGVNSTLVPSPNESSIIGISHYLPRTDKIVLDPTVDIDQRYTSGEFVVVEGVSSKNPIPPNDIELGMTIATLELPAYLYDPNDVKITVVDNRRFTMRDIGKIEDRVANLEEITSLSLLELDTKTFQVQDADGLSRFKSGFFVDDFKNNSLLDITNPDCKCDIDSENEQLVSPTDFYALKPELALDPSIDSTTADFSTDLALLDSGVKKTGDLVTLDYEETTLLDQPLASRVENVNPFSVISFDGTMNINPSADIWTRNVILDNGNRTVFGDQEGTFGAQVLVSSEPEKHIRSRNVEFTASTLKPNTRYYPFFDSTSGIDIVPKLIEVTMVSGSFQIGERVVAVIQTNNSGDFGPTFIGFFRLAQPNHKSGPFSEPTLTYSNNPYDPSITLPSTYSASSTVLNIDTASLAEEAQGRFFGRIDTETVIVGETSGAIAEVTDVKLITDRVGSVRGTFFIRDPLTTPVPPLRFTNGTKTFKLTSSENNLEALEGSPAVSSVETTYTTSGTVDTLSQTTVGIRELPPVPPPVIINQTFITNVFRRRRRRRGDPLAQSFVVDETGAFLTSVDIFMRKKDVKENLTVQIRTMELGTPTLIQVQNFAEVVLDPSQINVSEDASVATNVKFPSPIYLEGGEAYCVVLLAPTTNNYEAWIARMGDSTIDTQSLPDSESVVISQQYIGGSLFKSQNGSIWTPSQFEDLKLKLYKAKFSTTTSTAFFYNPLIDYESAQVPTLRTNGVKAYPRKLRITTTNITTAAVQNLLVSGRKVSDGTSSTDPFGFIESTGGPINARSITNPGIGYSDGQYSNVPLYSITGNGTGAIATVTIAGGVVNAINSFSNDGKGYAVGDVLGITTANIVKGGGAQITVDSITGTDTLYLTNVQGENFSSGDLVIYNDSGNAVSYANTDITASSVLNPLFEGDVLEVSHYNHGMTAGNNIVQISGVEPTTPPVKVTSAVGLQDSIIVVGAANTSEFATFEGITTSTGYVKINNEIIYYNSITNVGLGISERGIDGSLIVNHPINSLARKYEFNGLSLTGINTTHTMPSDATLTSKKDIDNYYLKIPRGASRPNLPNRGSGDNQASFTDERSGGGSNIHVSKNIQFNQVYPVFNTLQPGKTKIDTQIRTISATSVGGNEVSFLDQGYENIELNKINPLTTTRMVASSQNETARLSDLPKNRSSTLAISLSTEDENLSPVVDVMNGTVIYTRNRLNKPINDYALDASVKQNTGDPHAASYISNRVDLKQPATSLKVLISSDRRNSADFRALFKIFRADSESVDQSFNLFPGFDNLNDTDGDGFGDDVRDLSKNSGRPDALTPASTDGEFVDYVFTVDELSEFTGFQIKIVSSGTNEAEAPKFKDLRVIALA